MKILILTVSDQQHNLLNRYIDLHCNYDFNNWVNGFRGLAHECFFFDYYQSFVEEGPGIMEEKILAIVQNSNIDLVIIPNMYYEVGLTFLCKLRRQTAKSIMVFFDDSSRFENTNRFYVGLCDFIVTHESINSLKFYEKYHAQVDFFPCYPSYNFYQNIINHATDDPSERHEVCFVGARIADRETYINALLVANVPLTVYGTGWPNGVISQRKMVQSFAASKISLNFTKNASNKYSRQLKARAFEIVMAGGFLLTEHDDELADYFTVGTEIDTFHSVEECISKINLYLNNSELRTRMQQKATQKAKAKYSLESAWTTYLAKLENSGYIND